MRRSWNWEVSVPNNEGSASDTGWILRIHGTIAKEP